MTFIGTRLFNGRSFKIYDVPKDGDCLFSAFAFGLDGSISQAPVLREIAVELMGGMWEEWGGETDRGNFAPYANYDEYRASMSLRGTWAGPSEIQALGTEFRRRVNVYQGDTLIDTWNPHGFSEINLEFVRDAVHYRCLVEDTPNIVLERDNVPEVSVHSDVHSAFPETDYDQFLCNHHIDSTPYDYDADMFGGSLPGPFPIGSSKVRRSVVVDPPTTVDRRSSLALCTAMGVNYLWGCLFAGETASTVEPMSLGSLSADCVDCAAIFWKAERLVAQGDVPAWCCGKNVKSTLSETAIFQRIRDPIVSDLYYGSSQEARHFQENIRAYNNALCCAIPVTSYGRRNIRTGHVITLNGRVEFRCETSVAADLSAGQLYFLNMHDDILQRRMSRAEAPLRQEILGTLERYLRLHNDLIRTFEMAGNLQRSRTTERVSVLVNPHRDGFRVTDREFLDRDQAAYRPPGSNFVAAAYVGNRLRYNYDVLLFPQCDTDQPVPSHVIHEASPSLDTMLYPLIHLHSEDPWVQMTVERRREQRPRREFSATICGTQREYYASRIMIRPGEQGVLFQSRALFQQWLCDAAVKIEDNNLRYAEAQNEELQVCQLDSLKRFVRAEAETLGKRPGRVVILPQNVQTSERSMYNNYMDSVRISMEYGSPSMLVTFTTNPRWPEILSQLRSRGLGSDEYVNAPDVVVRVYLARLNALLGDIIHRGVFGRVLAYSGVHEFTTTMLPHFHAAIILDRPDVPSTPEDVDAIVCAEIPSRETEPNGFIYVMKYMIHRPCDGSSPNYKEPLCRPNGVSCTAGFPFPHRNDTILTRRGPMLRRREIEPIFSTKYGCLVDNRWVVPYSLKMGLRADNHLNIMLCGGSLPYKYLYGYFTKESRGQCVQGGMLRYFRAQDIQQDSFDWDEIRHFQDLRVIGPYEAIFKILGVPIARLSHSVETLPVHLPGRQYVYYRGDACDIPDLAQATSKLEGWFQLNCEDPSAHSLLYAQVVSRYRWVKGQWVGRSRATTLGRLMHVNPSPRNMELFSLRLLLLNRPGMKSFRDILTVDGVVHASFGEACAALGIADTGAIDYSSAMEEVVAYANPYQIRAFFATLIATCPLDDPETLWRQHRSSLSEDFVRRGCSRREAMVRSRREILRLVDDMIGDVPTAVQVPPEGNDGSFLLINERRVPALRVPVDDAESESSCAEECTPGEAEYKDELPSRVPHQNDEPDLFEEDAVDTRCVQYMAQYTEEQRSVHDEIMGAVIEQRNSVNFFSLMSPAGCGKTFLYKGLVLDCERRGIPVVSCAMTALAALLLPDADTCHKTFGVPVRARQDGTDRSFIELASPEAQRLGSAGLIVIDEASMMAKWQASLIDHLLRDIMANQRIVFGGKVVLLGGDMGQILPVIRNASSSDLISNSLPSWPGWLLRRDLQLSRNMRANDDPVFSEWVEKVRDGSANIPGTDVIRVPPEALVTCNRSAPMDAAAVQQRVSVTKDEYLNGCALVEKVYGDLSAENLTHGIIVAPTNDSTLVINHIVLEKLGGVECPRTYYSKTEIIYQDKGRQEEGRLGEFVMTTEELQNIDASNLPPHALTLRIGAIVMLLINIHKKDGLCNGARFVVTGLYTNTIRLQRLVPTEGQCNEIFLPKMKMRSDDVPVAGTIARAQFPVRLGFAITINKSQGQTFRKVGVFLQRPVFSHGQFYVAVSRAKSLEGLSISVIRGPRQGPISGGRGGRSTTLNVTTRNIVYPQVFQ